ncbi:MAG TPA: Crp/Fnr family transcriptional regulator [Saprospiraceae bacterium]|nr:Crp/Fnr family transcriptional regulator [Saprospiraceae bacterium]
MNDHCFSTESNHCAGCHSCTSNHNPQFAGLDNDRRQLIDQNRNKLKYKKGEIIYKEGIFPSKLFCLNRGKVMIMKEDDHGNAIITNLFKGVCFLGISEFVLQRPYETKCIALEDCEICLIHGKTALDFISDNKVFAGRIMAELANQFHNANALMLTMSKKNMEARLAATLLDLLKLFGKDSNGFLDVYLKRSHLALLSHMSEANLIRNLSEFQKMGLLGLEQKKIKIQQLEKLERIVNLS